MFVCGVATKMLVFVSLQAISKQLYSLALYCPIRFYFGVIICFDWKQTFKFTKFTDGIISVCIMNGRLLLWKNNKLNPNIVLLNGMVITASNLFKKWWGSEYFSKMLYVTTINVHFSLRFLDTNVHYFWIFYNIGVTFSSETSPTSSFRRHFWMCPKKYTITTIYTNLDTYLV